MGDQDGSDKEFKTQIGNPARTFEKSCRGLRLVKRKLADCKRDLSMETSIQKVLGLVSGQDLLNKVVEKKVN